MPEHVTARPLAHRLERWFAARLDQSVQPRRATARMYGLEIVDPDGIDVLDPMAVRTTFIVEGPDEFSVLCAPGTGAAGDLFDAVATVEWAWVPADGRIRPGRFTQRGQTRTVRVMLHDDLAHLDDPQTTER